MQERFSFSDRISSVDFKFEINKGQLIYSALLGKKHEKYFSAAIKNYSKDYASAYMLFEDPRMVFLDDNYKTSISQASENLKDMFAAFEKTTEFKELLTKTEEYKIWLEKEWEQKKEEIQKHLQEILKVELPNTTSTVFVIERSIGGGSYLGNNIIYWGHTEDWSNYSLVYLCHEYLHTFLSNGDLEHAVIELATDNELRIRLNGKGEYFKADGEKVGHQHLLDLEKNIYRRWLAYLDNPEKNIFRFIEEIKTDSPF